MTNHQLDQLIADAVKRLAEPAPPSDYIPPDVSSAAALARLIDHTILKPEAGEEQVRTVCAEAVTHNFASICVQPTWVPLCAEMTAESGVKVCTTIGFPHGATLPAVKAYEAEQVIALGAQEVDMVINVGRLRDGDYWAVYRDIAGVADAAHEQGALLKVIIETGLLDHHDKIAACVIAKEAGADFVKTSTGFNGGGATVEDIALMRRIVGPELGVKASGGVRSAEDALLMVVAGATRIGTSSGVKIMQEFANLGTAQQAGAHQDTARQVAAGKADSGGDRY